MFRIPSGSVLGPFSSLVCSVTPGWLFLAQISHWSSRPRNLVANLTIPLGCLKVISSLICEWENYLLCSQKHRSWSWYFSFSVLPPASVQSISQGRLVLLPYSSFKKNFFLATLHAMWNPSSPTRDHTCTRALETSSLNHWDAREVPSRPFNMFTSLHCHYPHLSPGLHPLSPVKTA